MQSTSCDRQILRQGKQAWHELVFLIVAISNGVYNPLPVHSQAIHPDEQSREMSHIDRLIKDDPYKALDYLREKLARAPNDSSLLVTTASLEMEMEQTKISAKRFERYFVLNPKSQNATVYIRLANDYRLMGQSDKALSLYNFAVTNMPNHAALYCERGCIYATLNQLEKGITDLTKAIQLEPKNTHFIFERGEIYAQTKRYAEAVADFTSVIKMGSSTATVYSLRAAMYKKMNRTDLAQKDMEQVNKFGMDMLDLK
jgi:tetratricopeptide (TPR) repeat protein